MRSHATKPVVTKLSVPHKASLWISAMLLLTLLPCAADEAPQLRWCLDNYAGRHEFVNGNVEGPVVDFMHELSRGAGFTLITSENTPFKRCLRYMEAGQTDLMTGLYATQERRQYMYFFPVYTGLREVLFYNKVEGYVLESKEHLVNHTVGIVRSRPVHTPDFDLIRSNNTIAILDSINDGLAALRTQHIDFLLTTAFPATHIIKSNKRFSQDIARLDLTLTEDPSASVYLGVSKHSGIDPQLIVRIQSALEQMQKQGVARLMSHALTPAEQNNQHQ